MVRLPVIVGFGGYNAAGRSSFHQGFSRMVFDSLSGAQQQDVLLGLATMTQLMRYERGHYSDQHGNQFTPAEVCHEYRHQLLDETLVRFLEEPIRQVSSCTSSLDRCGPLWSGRLSDWASPGSGAAFYSGATRWRRAAPRPQWR